MSDEASKVPPDKDALGLVEAIRAETIYNIINAPPSEHSHRLRLAIIRDNAERLAVLLEERDAEREGLAEGLKRALLYLDDRDAFVAAYGAPDYPESSIHIEEWLNRVFRNAARAALARVKEAS